MLPNISWPMVLPHTHNRGSKVEVTKEHRCELQRHTPHTRGNVSSTLPFLQVRETHFTIFLFGPTRENTFIFRRPAKKVTTYIGGSWHKGLVHVSLCFNSSWWLLLRETHYSSLDRVCFYSAIVPLGTDCCPAFESHAPLRIAREFIILVVVVDVDSCCRFAILVVGAVDPKSFSANSVWKYTVYKKSQPT